MSDIELSIQVVDENGEGISGRKVYLSYPHTWQEEFTDDDG
jgi:hypothetical protein